MPDGHQVYQYQQNKQSPLTLTVLTEHKKQQDISRWTDTKMWWC
jgi:hypothetical protein